MQKPLSRPGTLGFPKDSNSAVSQITMDRHKHNDSVTGNLVCHLREVVDTIYLFIYFISFFGVVVVECLQTPTGTNSRVF